MRKETKFFGEGLPYLKTKDLKGKLIAIEGTDGVGRSTQIDLLDEWLQVQGYGVVVTGWTRSNLMSKSIEMAKNGNMLDRRTFSLLYATDLADRLENQIIPALRSGFVVLADRYAFTAFARDSVRDPDMRWIKDVFGFAPLPDLVCYLRIDVKNLVPRIIESGGMNYWESGADLHLSDNIFDNFTKYQKMLIQAYDNMAEEYNFEVLDARRPVEQIQENLRQKISQLMARQLKSVKPTISLPTIGEKKYFEQKTLKAVEIEKQIEGIQTKLATQLTEESGVPTKRLSSLVEVAPVSLSSIGKVLPFSIEERNENETPINPELIN